MGAEGGSAAEVKRTHPFIKLAALVLIVGGAAVVVRATSLGTYLDRQTMLETLEALRTSVWAPLVYVVTYAAATALALPGSILTIVGGAVFGFGWGRCRCRRGCRNLFGDLCQKDLFHKICHAPA